MSGPYPRTRHATSGASAANSTPLSGDRLFDEWRGDVNRQLDASATAQNQVALILERLTNRLDEHDRRIKALEDAPIVQRRAADSQSNRQAQWFMAACGALTVLAYALPHLHWQ